MPLVILTQPANEPVSLIEAKDHIRVVGSLEDDVITSLIVTARQYIEQSYNVMMISQTWRSYHNSFIDIVLDLLPVTSIVSIKYIDINGTEQTLSSSIYDVDLFALKASLELSYNQSWPSVRSVKNTITVEFVVGYGAPTDIPDPLKHAILLLVGYLYENREHTTEIALTELPLSFKHLMLPYRAIKL